jgi:tight adherence protein C
MEALIAISVFISVTCLMLALLGRPRNVVQQRLEAFRGMVLAGDDRTEREPGFMERVGRPVAAALLRSVGAVLPPSLLAGLRWRLTRAGDPVGVVGLLVIWAVCAAGLPGVLFLVFAGRGGLDSMELGVTVLAGLLGVYLPWAWLDNRTRERQHRILKALPDAIDLLTTSVEAGLGIDAAFGQVAEKIKGPLAQELRRVLRDMAMGAARRDALTAFAERVNLPEVQTFVNALIQAEQMGVSLGHVIRVQADQMRLKRRQRAEEQAHQAPVKMTIPLVLFIFPVIFVVILGPACIQIKEVLIER